VFEGGAVDTEKQKVPSGRVHSLLIDPKRGARGDLFGEVLLGEKNCTLV